MYNYNYNLGKLTATGIVFNGKGQILLIKHKILGVWLPPGGGLEQNEFAHIACIREVFEETGIKVNIMSHNLNLTGEYFEELPIPFCIRRFKDNTADSAFLCTAESYALKPQKSEVDDIGWYSLSEYAKMQSFEDMKKVVNAAAKHLKIV